MRTILPFFTALLLQLVLSACHRQAENDDARRTDSLLTATTDQLFSNPQKADSIFQKMQATLTDSICWYRLQVFRGTAWRMMGDSTRSEQFYKKVEAWCQRTAGSKKIEGLLWNHRGIEEAFQGKAEQAAICFQRAFDLLNEPPKTKELIATSTNLADNYMQTGDLPQSANYYRYALYLCDSLHDYSNRTAIYSGLGQTYMDLGNFTEAHHFFSLAGQNIDKEDMQTRFFYYFSLGNCYYFEERYAEALSMFHHAGELAQLTNNPSFQLACEGNLAEVYLMADSLAQARTHLSRCEAFMKDAPGTPSLTAAYVESLVADLALAEGRTNEAQTFMKKNADSLLAQSPRYLMLHYRRLEHYATRDRLWEKAYIFGSRADKYADSLQNQQTQKAVIDIGLRYRRDTTLLRQQLYLSDLQTRNAQQRGYLFLAVSTAIVLALAATLTILIYRRRTQSRFKQQMERMTELRMDIVRNRVSPHYIFNVLGTILPKLQGHPDLEEPVDLLIDVLRGNLLASGKVAVPLADELTLVRNYVALHHYSKGERPAVTWEVDSSLLDDGVQVLSMALQIPVENALKHAFPTLSDHNAIHISVIRKEDAFCLCVTDNGCGYNPGNVAPTGRDTGTGLRLISRTIDILNQYNRHAASLSICNVPAPHRGTQTIVTIPLDYNFSLPEKK